MQEGDSYPLAAHPQRSLSPDDAAFLRCAEAGIAERFGHREHLRLAFAAAKSSDGSPAAVAAICERAIRRIAARAGEPDRYHATMTRAWATIMAHRVRSAPQKTFEELLADEPSLLETDTITRHFSRARLFGPAARNHWVEPDLRPLSEL